MMPHLPAELTSGPAYEERQRLLGLVMAVFRKDNTPYATAINVLLDLIVGMHERCTPVGQLVMEEAVAQTVPLMKFNRESKA